MQMRTVLIGAFALVFGISAAIGVYILGNAPKTEMKTEMVSVVIAAADISRGDTLTPELLTKKDWPKELVPEGAISDAEGVLERTSTMSMMKGDLIVEGKLAPKGAGRGLAAVVASGMRAFTVHIPNVATGVAGFVQPGNRVDVLLTMSSQAAGDQTGGGSEITLLQNVEILAVDQRIDTTPEGKATDKDLRSVTLMVLPADAAKLDLGQNRGTLHLVLRNPADQGTDYIEPVTVAELHRNPADSLEKPPQGAVKPAAKIAGPGLATIIRPGMRAFTVQTPNVATGVAGFLLPGNRVDVLLNISSQGAGDQSGGGSEITLLQNVEILAVDQRSDVSRENASPETAAQDVSAQAAPAQNTPAQYSGFQDNKMSDKELRSVTLMVSPANAAKLHLGQSKGTLHLVLRNPHDQGIANVETVTMAGLGGAPAESKPKKRTQQIRTLRGSQSGSIVFQTSSDDFDEPVAEEPRPAPPAEPSPPAEAVKSASTTKDV